MLSFELLSKSLLVDDKYITNFLVGESKILYLFVMSSVFRGRKLLLEVLILSSLLSFQKSPD